MEPIGQRLKEARERKGISLAEARQALRIHASYLDALEAEEFDKLPAPVYVRAFLRQYGRYVGVDPEALVADYNARYAGKEDDKLNVGWTAAPPTHSRWGMVVVTIAVIAIVGLGVLGTAFYYHQYQVGKAEANRPVATAKAPDKKPAEAPTKAAVQPPATNAPANAPANTPAATAPTNTPAANAPANAPVANAPVSAPAANAPANAPAANAPANAPVANAPAATAPSIPAGQGVAVSLIAERPSWVQVKVDGKTAFAGTLQPGQAKSWQAGKSIDVRTGNAGGVRARVNGQDIGALGKPGQVLNRSFRTQQAAPAAPTAPAPANP